VCLGLSFYNTLVIDLPFATPIAGVGVLLGALVVFLVMAGIFAELVYKTGDNRLERLSLLTAKSMVPVEAVR
jgi:hypothetical protein